MQSLPSPARSKPDINPLRVNGTVDPTAFPNGFHHHFAFKDTPAEFSQQNIKHNIFRRYRQILEQLSHLRDAGSCPFAFLQDDEGIVALQITIRGLRLFPPNIPLMELQYLCATREHIQTPQWGMYQAAVSASLAGAGCGPPMKIRVSVLEAVFIKEVLTANAVRLDPQYVQFCVRHWELEDQDKIKVSFLVPASPLSDHQVEHLQARCGNGDCGQPAQMTCVRCQKVKYCTKECQKAHWKQHKPQCFCKEAGRS
ncbi:hypothetical protein WJX73_009757 [Symbiochloris irregularis]|uniref:MYND-type domain-containing protein n=1 Tax=Symbiochloris irregularis TaxID=706552 RepID=A0AAW1NPW6_9CHLO